MRACIITIGNEILIGRILNTNSQFLARKLTALGIDVIEIVTVKDGVNEIKEAVEKCCAKANIIITTGGLGPTYDDITLYAISVALRRPYRLDEGMLRELKRALERLGVKLDEVRMKMAFAPAGSKPIPNDVGAAPGAKIVDKCIIYSLPGVPSEMQDMFEKYVEPEIAQMSNKRSYEVCEALDGVREADVAKIIKKFVKEGVYVKTHPSLKEGKPTLKICVLGYAESEEKAKKVAEETLKGILERIEKDLRRN